MSRAVFVHQHGGPEVLRLEDRELPPPGPGEVRLRHRAIGLNFIDVYQRSGLYKVPLPFVAGNEAAGDVVAVGEGVTDVEVGDRVSYQNPVGAYAEERNIPAGRLVHVPDGIDYEVAAAVTLKGVTAYYLLHETWKVKPGDTVLVHAAAGGVGSLLVPWAKHLGATVIGTAGSQRKLEQAKALGADHVIDYTTEDLRARLKDLTDGRGVDVVFDPVGGDAFDAALRATAWEGRLVIAGFAGGRIQQIPANLLLVKNIAAIGFFFAEYRSRMPDLVRDAFAEMAGWLRDGKLKPHVSHVFPAEEVAAAMELLTSRRATGKIVLAF